MGRLSAYFYILRNFRLLAKGVKFVRLLSELGMLYVLEGLNLLSFLEEPRSREEILEYIGDVKDLNLFKVLLNVIVENYGREVDGKIVIDKEKVEKIRRFSKHPFSKQFSRLLEAYRGLFPENLLALLQKRQPRFDWSEVMVAYYTQLRAPIYSLGRELLFRFADARRRLKGKTLLEVGGGFGYETEHILKYFKGDIRVYVADFFKEVIDLARAHEFEFNGRRLVLEELDNVQFVLLDPEFRKPWDFEDESFDGVLAYLVLHWVKDPRKFILESGRVLAPKGLFFGATGIYKKEPSALEVLSFRIQGANRFLTRDEFEKYLQEAQMSKPDIILSALFKANKIGNNR